MASSDPLLFEIFFPMPLLIPIGFAAAVSRYRLFGVDDLAKSSAPYLFALASSLLVCLAVSLGIDLLLRETMTTTTRVGHWLGVIAAVMTAEPLRRLLRRLIDRAFARDRRAFSRACASLAVHVAAAEDASAVCAAVERELDASPVALLNLCDLAPADVELAVRRRLETAGALRVVELPEPTFVDALIARGFELVVWISDSPAPGAPELLALTAPLASRALDRADRDALVLVGRVIGATLGQRAARTALDHERSRAEDERRHIAMELHDGLGATLTTARMVARRLRRQRFDDAESRALDSLDAALSEGLGDLRASLWSLDPAHTSWTDLLARIQRHGGDACEAGGVAFELEAIEVPAAPPSPALRLAVLRITQEALSNALKHGNPSCVRVSLRSTCDRMTLTVEDDGAGLRPPITGHSVPGRGLGNMSRRARALAGELRVQPRDGGGTRVVVDWPAARVQGTA